MGRCVAGYFAHEFLDEPNSRKELPDRVSDKLQSNQISLGPNKHIYTKYNLPGQLLKKFHQLTLLKAAFQFPVEPI